MTDETSKKEAELAQQQQKEREDAIARRTTPFHPGTLGTPPLPEKDQVEREQGAQPVQTAPRAVPYRAKFVVDEITRTTRGVAVLSLKAAYDANIAEKQRLAPGANPKGDISVEVADAYADGSKVAHGSVFYLISA